ncbi:hypothetical protein E2X65_23350 [Salmonella enterica]|nr:hypothetical protein [Salmonella enterica]
MQKYHKIMRSIFIFIVFCATSGCGSFFIKQAEVKPNILPSAKLHTEYFEKVNIVGGVGPVAVLMLNIEPKDSGLVITTYNPDDVMSRELIIKGKPIVVGDIHIYITGVLNGSADKGQFNKMYTIKVVR